jgi:hypothetical protein
MFVLHVVFLYKMFVFRKRLYTHPVYCMRSLSGFVNSVTLPRNKLFRLRTNVAVFMHTAHVFISLGYKTILNLIWISEWSYRYKLFY